MKVLWSVNTVLPKVAKKLGMKQGHAISWVDAMQVELNGKDDIELCIVCNGGNQVKKLKMVYVDNIKYYVMPDYRDSQRNWEIILKDIKPDVIHIYGTERKHNMYLINKYKDRIPMIISLQGLINEYVKHYYAFIPYSDIFKNITIKDFISGGILGGKIKFTVQAKFEKKMLQDIKYFEGRSEWDKAISSQMNPNAQYYHCPRMIRKEFFNFQWRYDEYEKFSIFVHQGNYPIKGLHFMLDALAIIKNNYPATKLYISGNNILENNRKKEDGYTRYIRRKIHKLGLEKNIEFTGFLDAKQLADKLSKMHVCVIPSAIENAPNALAEAMLIGTPCVASYVGGNAQMLDYGNAGLLYCYYEPQILAARIEYLFENEKVAIELSQKAMKLAKERHDSNKLVDILLNIYQNVYSSFRLDCI